VGRLETNLGNELTDGALSLRQDLQDPDASGVGQGLEELRLDLLDRLGHEHFLPWGLGWPSLPTTDENLMRLSILQDLETLWGD